MTNQTDEQVEAFGQILLSHTEMCHSVALALTRDPQRAQKLARQVLTGAWQRHDNAQDGEHVKKMLLTALRKAYLKDYGRGRAVPHKTAIAERV